MKKIFFGLTILCLALQCLTNQSFGKKEAQVASFEKKNILVLNSYSENFEWTYDITLALKDRLAKSHLSIDLYIEYLDTKRFPDRAYWQHLFTTFLTKYQSTSIDLIVTSDNNALDFLFQYRDRFYPNIPVVFCGLNNFKPEMLENQKNVTGIAESTNLKSTVDLALKLHPGTEQLVFIASSARSSTLNLEQLEELRPILKQPLTIEIWKDHSIEENEKSSRQLKANSLLFILGRSRNLDGDYLNTEQMGQRLSSASSVPIYTLWDFYLGTGIVGGKLINGIDQGRSAGELVLKVLNGVSANEIPVIVETPTSYMFDYLQMQKHGIDEENLPNNSRIINKPVSSYEDHKKTVWAILATFTVLICLLITLLVNIYRRRQVERELQKHHDQLEELVNERTTGLTEVNQALQESEINLSKAQEIAHLGHWKLIPETGKVEGSKEFFKIFELSPNQQNFEAFLDVVHPDDRELDRIAIQAGIENGIPWDIEHRLLMKDCSIKWLSARGKPLFDDNGRITKIIGTVQDITDRKKYEEALVYRERQLVESQKIAKLGSWDLNLVSKKLYWSIETYRLFDNDPEKFIPSFDEFARLVHPDDFDIMQKSFNSALESDETPYHVQVRIINGTEREWVMEAVGEVRRDEEGKAQSIFGTAQDITERIHAEVKLQESHSRLLTILNSLDAIVYVADMETYEILFANQLVQHSFGDVRGKVCWQSLQKDQTGPCEFCTNKYLIDANGKPTGNYIWEFQNTITGEWLNISDRAIKWIDGRVVRLEIAINITKRREMEQELQRAHDNLEQRVEERTLELQKANDQLLHAEKLSAIGSLSASIAHEFNSPLAGVTNVIRGIKKRADFDEDDTELIDMAILECRRMKDLIINLQSFNRPTSGIMAFIDIHEIIDSLLLLSKKHLHLNQITVGKKYADNLPQIMAVADQIKQVILNLLNNSVDACDNGGEITIHTEKDNDNIIIRIKDNGIGIKPKDIDHIFDPFYSTKPEVKGTGLGLSVSYGIIKKHGGTIDVKSELGKGSIFSVTLPISGVIDA